MNTSPASCASPWAILIPPYCPDPPKSFESTSAEYLGEKSHIFNVPRRRSFSAVKKSNKVHGDNVEVSTTVASKGVIITNYAGRQDGRGNGMDGSESLPEGKRRPINPPHDIHYQPSWIYNQQAPVLQLVGNSDVQRGANG